MTCAVSDVGSSCLRSWSGLAKEVDAEGGVLGDVVLRIGKHANGSNSKTKLISGVVILCSFFLLNWERIKSTNLCYCTTVQFPRT